MYIQSDSFKAEKEEITKKVVQLLYFKDANDYTIYDVEKSEIKDIQAELVKLVPDIRKYFIYETSTDWLISIKNIIAKNYKREIYTFKTNEHLTVFLYIDNITKKVYFSFSFL